MKIILASDSHGNNKALDELALLYPDADLYLHAGDSEADEYMIMPFETVRGNCDHFSQASMRRIIDTPYGKLLMQHYPTIPEDIIEQYHIKIFIHGHTHIREKKVANGLLIICPGSIAFSRDKYDMSYAILDIDQNSVTVDFKSLLDKKS